MYTWARLVEYLGVEPGQSGGSLGVEPGSGRGRSGVDPGQISGRSKVDLGSFRGRSGADPGSISGVDPGSSRDRHDRSGPIQGRCGVDTPPPQAWPLLDSNADLATVVWVGLYFDACPKPAWYAWQALVAWLFLTGKMVRGLGATGDQLSGNFRLEIGHFRPALLWQVRPLHYCFPNCHAVYPKSRRPEGAQG